LRKEIGENKTIYGGEKKMFLLAISFIFAFTVICILLNSVLDGYFMWICIDKGLLTVYWQRKLVYEAKMQFNFKYPLWIPILPLAIVFTILLVLNRQINSKIIVHGIRIHHYHVGLLLIIIAALMLAIMASVSEPIVIWLYTKKTNIMEMLQGLSFIFTLWGAALILLDIKDIAGKLGMGENSA